MAIQGRTRAERNLLDAEVHDKQRVAVGGVNSTHIVKLGTAGEVGFHKGFTGLDDRMARAFGQTTRQQPMHEVSAWRLAAALGPPWSKLVPPCVLRNVDGKLGSLILGREGNPFGWAKPEEASPAGFFDALIGQQDRHPGNYLTTADGDLTLIDHGFCFAKPGDRRNHSMLTAQRIRTNPDLTGAERRVLKRLLSSGDLFGLDNMLEPDRAQALRERARKMLLSGTVLQVGEY